MRIVAGNGNVVVKCLDEPGQGNACHSYSVEMKTGEGAEDTYLAQISFQNGPIREVGINGIQNEDLLAIVIDRLQGFESGNFSCRENGFALTLVEEALMWLNKRTANRKQRGVEGKNVV